MTRKVKLSIYFFFLLLLGVGEGCKSTHDVGENNCRFLKRLIKDHWKQDPETGYFSMAREQFRKINAHWGCLEGKTKLEVEKIFGTPTEKRNQYYWLYYQSGTVPCEFSNCLYFKFRFDDAGKLEYFNQGGSLTRDY